MGEFQKKFQDIANHTPLGILDELHKKHNVWIPDDFIAITDEAKKEFLALYPKEELGGTIQQYIQAKQNLVNVQKEMGQVSRDEARELALLKCIVKWFGMASAEG